MRRGKGNRRESEAHRMFQDNLLPGHYLFGEFRLDLHGGELLRNETAVVIEPKVFALLSYLVAHHGRLVGRQELLDAVWPDAHVTDASLSQAMAALRKALDDEPRHARYIATLPRRGYKFIAEVAKEKPEHTTNRVYHLIYGLRDFILAPGENIIGRAGDAAVRIRSDEVSRHHARIVVSSSGATIEDLGSTNGTLVRGKRIERPCDLRDGDEIVIGGLPLTFQTARLTKSTATVPKRT
jgi:DNA-binding winged helix-turn-helix (wHTH) protein